MTTAREVEILTTIATAMTRDMNGRVGSPRNVLDAILSAPEPVRLKLAELLNPWRPIETAPKDDTWIMISWGGKDVAIVLGRWAHARTLTPTHWLPLPAPPGIQTEG